MSTGGPERYTHTHTRMHRKDKAGDILYLSTSPIKSSEKGGQTFTHQLNNELCVCYVFVLLLHTQVCVHVVEVLQS